MPIDKLLILSLLSILVICMHYYRIRRVNNKPLWDDGFTYLRVAREIRKQRGLPPFMNCYFAGDERGQPFTLPPLLMVLLAPFTKLPYSVLIHTSFVIDIVIALSVALASQHLMGCDQWQALCASLVYLMTPINARTSAFLTPRSLGLLCFLGFLVWIYRYLMSPSPVPMVLASLSAALLLLSQRMVTQIVLIITPLLVVVCWLIFGLDLLPVLYAVCGGLLLAFALTGGRYKETLVDHVKRIVLHARHGDQTNFRKNVGNPIQIIKANPWVVLVIPALWNQTSWECGFIVLLAYLAGILLLSEFWILGNSVNHMFFAGPLVALIISKNLLTSVWLDVLLLVIGIGSFMIVMREYSAMRAKAIDTSWLQCFDYMKRENLTGKILVLPRVACPPLIYYTGLTIVSGGHGSDAMSFNRLFLQRSLSADLKIVAQFAVKHRIEYFLIETDKFSMDDLIQELRASGSEPNRMFTAPTLCLMKVQ